MYMKIRPRENLAPLFNSFLNSLLSKKKRKFLDRISRGKIGRFSEFLKTQKLTKNFTFASDAPLTFF